jgi:hypothetical protein
MQYPMISRKLSFATPKRGMVQKDWITSVTIPPHAYAMTGLALAALVEPHMSPHAYAMTVIGPLTPRFRAASMMQDASSRLVPAEPFNIYASRSYLSFEVIHFASQKSGTAKVDGERMRSYLYEQEIEQS